MKKLSFFLMAMLLTFGIGNAWAEEVEMSTFTATAADMDSYISYSTAQGGGTTAPAVNNGQIRLYQGNPGGSITITAKNGVTITEVTIGSGMATQIRWQIDGGTTDAANTSLAKDAKNTKSGLSASKVTCHCYGSNKDSRLYVNYLKVVYTVSAGSETPEPEPDVNVESLSHTWDWTKASYSSSSTTKVSWSATDVNMVLTKETSSTNANNYLGGTNAHTRVYKDQKITFTPGSDVTLTSIQFIATTSDYASHFVNATWTNASASASGTTVTVTPTDGTSVVSCVIKTATRATSVTVTYTKAAENPDEVKYTVTANVNDPSMGTVTGAGEYGEGKTATLTANPNAGYKFVNWSNGSTDNPLKITVTENVELTANFAAIPPITCSQIKDLTIGEAFVLGEFIVTYVNGAYTYIKDATGASLIYSYNYGLKAGDVVTGLCGTRAEFNKLIQITPSVTKADLNITEGTAPQPEVLAAAPTAADLNKYVTFNGKMSAGATFTASANNTEATIIVAGTNVKLRNTFKVAQTFIKDATYSVVGCVSTYYENLQVLPISATKVSLTISATATGGKVTGTGEYMEGDEATLIATANEGYEFVNWTWADEVVCTTPEYTFEVEEAMSLVANFAKKTYTVTATAENGSVAGLAAAGKYEHGAEANLTATAAEGYEFTCWTSGEDTVSTANPYKFTVTADVALVANFKEAAPTYDLELVAKDLYSASDEVKTQFEGSNSLNPDMTISVTLFASKYGTYTSTGAEEDEFNAFYAGSQILGELTYSYSDELKSDLVVIIGTITDEEETSTIKVTMYEEYLEPTDVVVLNNLQKNVQKMGWMSNLMLFNAANDTIITISGCDGTYGKYTAWGTFGADELEGKGEWKNDGENDVFVGVLYNADKTKVFQVTATTPAEKIKEYTYELADVSFTLSEVSNTLIIEAYAEEPEPVQVYLELAGWTPEQTIYAVGEMYGSIANMDNIEGADVANLTYEVESYLEGKELTITAQVEDAAGNTYLLILTGEYDSTTTALDNLNTTVAPVKAIINGQLVIINNGVQFNAQGQVIK